MADTLRPHMVRADTIDLQDQHNPSAAHHTMSPPHSNGLAPHQAASLHHVAEERHSEERSLADAWNIGASHGPSDDSQATISNSQLDHDEHDADNSQHQDMDDGDLVDSDAEVDDDLADRISSSPSIDDGALNLLDSSPFTEVSCWPPRSSSRDSITPPSSPMWADFNSPVFRKSQRKTLGTEVHREDASDRRSFSLLKHHHPLGRYMETGAGHDEQLEQTLDVPAEVHFRQYPFDILEVIEEEEGPESSITTAPTPLPRKLTRTDMPPSGLPINRPLPGLPSTFSLTSISSTSSVSLSEFLLPIDDPLLSNPPSPTGSDDSWESVPSDEDPFDQDSVNPDENLNDDADDIFFDLSNRFMESGWAGVYLRETEDIDFEFVYALHTFVATVEGQANATKGDTMVLLDDSNSYWWLVRVVKDSSIGYLPAEHIETPTERLARLNKHRNIDLSATMLGDQSEKSRNPIKKAIRRRNAKTVQFAAPTYVEASDYDYSSDEEGDESNITNPYADSTQEGDAQHDATQEGDAAEEENAQARTEETKTPLHIKRNSFDREQAAMAAAAAAAGVSSTDEPQITPKLIDRTEAAPLKSPKRAGRNTDSFLKDDNQETRKITLTPGLLREEGNSIKSTSSESTRTTSLEMIVKQISPPEQSPKKEGKEKKKEKQKGGMLSGLFKSKKKDKKAKEEAAEQAEAEKNSLEATRMSEFSPLTSGSDSPIDRNGSVTSPIDTRQTPPNMRLQSPPQPVERNGPVSGAPPLSGTGFLAELQGSEVGHEMDSSGADSSLHPNQAIPETKEKEGPLSPITNILRSASSGGSSDPKPKKAKRSKKRVELDDFDTPTVEQEDKFGSFSEESAASTSTFMHGTELVHVPTPGDGGEDDSTEDDIESEDDMEEPSSAVTNSSSLLDPPSLTSESAPSERDITPEARTRTPDHRTLTPPDDHDNDPTPTAPRSPQLAATTPTISEPLTTSTSTAAPTHYSAPLARLSTTITPSSPTMPRSPRSAPTSAQAPAWSDAHLRAWLDDGSEVKDLLMLVRGDKTAVTPVAPDHPMMKGLYVEQRKGVTDMMGQLDGLLSDFLGRRGVVFS